MCPLALLAAALLVPAAHAPAAPFSLGYVSHFPMIRHDDDQVAAAGANVMLVRAPWALIEPQQGHFEFGMLDEQLQWAGRTGVRLLWVIEAGPAHAAGVPWLVDLVAKAGECQAGLDGKPVNDPSIFSPTYRCCLETYITRVVGYLRNHPLADRIYGYSNGCEWWYPLSNSYGRLDAAEFAGWALARHGGLAGLNAAWGTALDGEAQGRPPDLIADDTATTVQGRLSPRSASADLCYATTAEARLPVAPGQGVTFEAQFDLRECKTGGVKLEIAWMREGTPELVDISHSAVCTEPGPNQKLEVTAPAPAGAKKAWLLAKLLGAGEVSFRRLAARVDGGGASANPGLDPAQRAWQFIRWEAGEPERVTNVWDAPGDARIAYRPSAALKGNPSRPVAVVADWVEFRASQLAGFMDWFAGCIKQADPAHPVVTYTTFAFANAFEWDYVQQMAVELDRIARQGKHLDVIGMQLASAAGDTDSVACAFDIVRKVGKPMWAVDLLDFSLGTAGGEALLTRTSLAAVQHGACGIQYYCWFGTPVYNYTDLGLPGLKRMADRVMATASAVAGMHPEASVALVMPRMPLYALLPEPANDWRDFMGWYKLLRRMGLCVDVYTLAELPELAAARYRAVIVPDCAYLPREAATALRRCAATGTPLVTSGRFGLRDEAGDSLPLELRPTPTSAFSDAAGSKLLGDCWRHPSPTDTPPRLTTRPGSPDWSAAVVRETVARLSALGVSALHDPAAAPVSVVPFAGAGKRRAVVIPDGDWSGRVRLGGVGTDVPAVGSVVDLPAR